MPPRCMDRAFWETDELSLWGLLIKASHAPPCDPSGTMCCGRCTLFQGAPALPASLSVSSLTVARVPAQHNDLQMIVRAHECVMDGFERFAQGHLITLFSATNYCGTANNAGAILVLGRDFVMVSAVLHS